MKSSGSVWFVYGVAVVVTFVIGVISFGVFVLSKVFGGSAPTDEPAPASVVQARPTAATPSRAPKVTQPRVYGVRAAAGDARQLVVVVATPTGCTRFLRATTYAEGPGAVAVRVTQQAYKTGCEWEPKPVLATARTAIGERALIVNGSVWTRTANGRYEPALRPGSPSEPQARDGEQTRTSG